LTTIVGIFSFFFLGCLLCNLQHPKIKLDIENEDFVNISEFTIQILHVFQAIMKV